MGDDELTSSERAPISPEAQPAVDDDFVQLEENEPYLGPAWAVAMLILYFLKEAFPAEKYSFLWWFQVYVITLVIAITVFTLIKRRQFYRLEKDRAKKETEES